MISVASDSGMMGGSVSHEFMLLTPIGEDSIVLCDDCGYKANMEAAESILEPVENAPSQPLTKVHTPGMHTIEEVCTYLHADPKDSAKPWCTRPIMKTNMWYCSCEATWK